MSYSQATKDKPTSVRPPSKTGPAGAGIAASRLVRMNWDAANLL